MPRDSVPIPPDTYARVVTDDLRVRSKPGVSEDSKKLEPLLQNEWPTGARRPGPGLGL